MTGNVTFSDLLHKTDFVLSQGSTSYGISKVIVYVTGSILLHVK